MKLIAIDPGYDKCGFALFESGSPPEYIDSGLIKTVKTDTPPQRLLQLSETLKHVLDKHKPEYMIVERLFFSKNTTTALGVSQAVGVLYLAAAQHHMPVYEITPNEIKSIVCGDGKADKYAVQKMLWLQMGKEIKIADDDESDAIACGFAGGIILPTLIRTQQIS